MMSRFLATTAVAALIAGGAYAQTMQTQQPDQQAQEQQDGLATQGQEIIVRAGDTIVIDSADAQFTLRFSSVAQPSTQEQQVQPAEPAEPAEQPETTTTEPGEQPAGQQDGTAAAPTPPADGQAPAQERFAGQEITVSDGDTIVVEADQDDFELTFQVRADAAAAAPAGQAAQEQPAATPGAVAREDLQAGDLQQIRADDLIGSTIYGADDENIGNVGDVILTEDGQVDAVIVDVGGFLGIGTREVAVGIDNIDFMIDGENSWYVYTPFTAEQLEAHPAYDATTYNEQRDQQRLIAR